MISWNFVLKLILISDVTFLNNVCVFTGFPRYLQGLRSREILIREWHLRLKMG